MSLRTVSATRYVTPLREGGSMPAVVEADDDGMYVLKFRGAGQGPRALVAEWIVGELARAPGFDVPEIVFVDLDPVLARTEGDPEIQSLIRASGGLNRALDYLPGAANFDPLAWTPDPALASRIVWFDALVGNVDRSARNTNLLVWHGKPWLIDHGATLTFHHGGQAPVADAGKPFAAIADHVLLPAASALAQVDAELAARLTPDVLQGVVDQVPESFLALSAQDQPGGSALATAAAQRQAYLDYFTARVADRARWLEGAERARA